jgi:cell pole-organizing protein PopZ
MDEEALRELVAEIVRTELQGALGERITRNVRKLVRREIHRALTAQELE